MFKNSSKTNKIDIFRKKKTKKKKATEFDFFVDDFCLLFPHFGHFFTFFYKLL